MEEFWSKLQLISWWIKAIFQSPIEKEPSLPQKELRWVSLVGSVLESELNSIVGETWIDSDIARRETFRRVPLSISPKERGLPGLLNPQGGILGGYLCCPPHRSMIRRWKLIPSRRSCCQGPSSPWSQIHWKPLPSALAIDVLPSIAYHGGTQDSCPGFD
jgi:hypothetical protein